MAPQRETTGLADGESTFYGALELKNEQSTTGRAKYIAALALVAVAVTTAALAFAPTSQSEVNSVTDALLDLGGPGGEGDDLSDETDCQCLAGQQCNRIPDTQFGYCMVHASADPNCIGFDYKPAFSGTASAANVYATFIESKTISGSNIALTDAAYYSHCNIVQGQYDCYGFPCKNEGYCIDGSNGYTCVCAWGWQGTHCEIPIPECAVTDNTAVCHQYATCSDLVPSDQSDGRGYACECNPGFFGDGYAVGPNNSGRDGWATNALAYGSVLVGAPGDGPRWVNRMASSVYASSVAAGTAANASPYDKNVDSIVDVFGCTDVNDCASTPCQNGGRCIDLWDGAYRTGGTRYVIAGKALAQSSAFECDCTVTLPAERWAGDYCEENVDECTAGLHNCDKDDRSECTDSQGSFSCSCREFWEGDGYSTGETPATWGCTSAAGCSESTGYIGCTDVDDCSIRIDLGTTVAFTTPCQNGATCVNDGLGTGLYKCYCVIGWRGHDCEIDINECDELSDEALGCDNNAYCSNTPGSWQCLCNNGWTGDGQIEGGCYDADDCEFSPCQHGGTCTDCGTLCYICDCIVGWRGKSCETDWNECVMGIHTCHEFAMCVNVPGSFECECEPGYSGDGYMLCNEVNDCYRWSDSAAQDDNTLVDYGERRVYCDSTTTQTSNSANPCYNVPTGAVTNGVTFNTALSRGRILGATWMDDEPIACGAAGWTCYKGNADAPTPVSIAAGLVHQCGEYDAAKKIFQQHGNCEDVGPAAFVCTCDAGWSDSNCDLDIDECARATDTCHKYATCTNTDGSFTCKCNNGFSGDGIGTCHDIDDCTIGTRGCDKGFCTDLGVGDFRCTCDAGFNDRLCDMDIDECASMTHTCYVNQEQCFTTEQCMNGAKRNDQTGKLETGLPEYADACRMNSKGQVINQPCDQIPKMCKTLQWEDDAKSVPKICKYDYKNAVCTNTEGSYRCACRAGFVGNGIGNEGCTDVDECGSAPCENGSCMDDGPLAYACQCDEGWMDTNCDFDVNECLSGAHDCHPDGKCVNVPGAYYCRCVSGFTGDGYTCTDLDDCDPDPCDPEHGVCVDQGANRYGCICTNGPQYDYEKLGPYGGFAPPDCATDPNECLSETHECDPNADCFDVYGSYICECKESFYGDGLECAPCTECRKYCPEHAEAGKFASEVSGVGFGAENTLAACGSDNYIFTGYTPGMIPCDSVDRNCINVNECLKEDVELIQNCDDPSRAQCTDTDGSFECECIGEYWGTGIKDECHECTECGKGEYMKDDCTSTSDRTCRVTIPDGNYAMQTDSGSVAQCLTHWKEPGQIFPERYSWGGRSTTATEGKDELGDASKTQSYGTNWRAGKDGAKAAPDYCENPVCGVCDWNDEDPKDLLVQGMETVWTFKRLEDDLYLILNGADGNGFRCFGFQTAAAPYPTMIVWQDTQMEAAKGTCGAVAAGSASTSGTVTTTTGLTPECTTNLDCQPVRLTTNALSAAVPAGTLVEQTINAGGVPRQSARGFARFAAAASATSLDVTMESDQAFTATPTAACASGAGVQAADCVCGSASPSVICAAGSTCTSGSSTCSILYTATFTVGGAAQTIEAGSFTGVVINKGSVGTLTSAFDSATSVTTVTGVSGSAWAAASPPACLKENLVVGEWVTDKKGVEYKDIERCEKNRVGLDINCKLDYFCGMSDDVNGDAYTKLMSNGGAVWNVKQLGCTMDAQRRWLCGRNPEYDNQFLIRSLAGQDANRDNAITEADYECLYFPQIAGGQYTHPRRAPRAASNDGVWGGLVADADGNNDNECGILLPEEGMTQEQALVANKQATWSLIPLPDY